LLRLERIILWMRITGTIVIIFGYINQRKENIKAIYILEIHLVKSLKVDIRSL